MKVSDVVDGVFSRVAKKCENVAEFDQQVNSLLSKQQAEYESRKGRIDPKFLKVYGEDYARSVTGPEPMREEMQRLAVQLLLREAFKTETGYERTPDKYDARGAKSPCEVTREMVEGNLQKLRDARVRSVHRSYSQSRQL